ncbi:ero1-like protein isoform X2 [Bacillus rossius redtenbacheri]|uniref:ero1-like protein isoform X2 n=1 Tax=Bacillus rossius redtenbacheri TaxID=93214 RepID=UPI002FDEEDBA
MEPAAWQPHNLTATGTYILVLASLLSPPDDVASSCFCLLKGRIDDCGCSVDTVDHFNNIKVYPRLHSLLNKNYFRFFKVNLKQECPFWPDDSRCTIRYCHVEPCVEENIPLGLKGVPSKNAAVTEDMSFKYSQAGQNVVCDQELNKELGYLNTTISTDAHTEFARWQAHDDARDSFCHGEDDLEGAEYVDLLLNPERYTGYRGEPAHRVWHSIYMENCFRPQHAHRAYIESSALSGMCLEKRVFYRTISGLHTSITIHALSKYLQSDETSLLGSPGGKWGPNLEEFRRRFNPELTDGEGPSWLRNLYFVYLLELRALAKAAPYLEREEYYTGSEQEDEEVRLAVNNFLSVVRSFPDHFDESSMFSGGQQARELKEEFRQHFRNISRIMDCVGCDKCRLWGKLQIQGLGTALKILFSGKFDSMGPFGSDLSDVSRNKFQLKRSEIVALFNAFGRLSTSIVELEKFRKMMR